MKQTIIVRPKQNASGDGWSAELKSNPGNWEFSKLGPEDVYRNLIYSLNYQVHEVPRAENYDDFEDFQSAFIHYKQGVINRNYDNYIREDADYKHYVEPVLLSSDNAMFRMVDLA